MEMFKPTPKEVEDFQIAETFTIKTLGYTPVRIKEAIKRRYDNAHDVASKVININDDVSIKVTQAQGIMAMCDIVSDVIDGIYFTNNMSCKFTPVSNGDNIYLRFAVSVKTALGLPMELFSLDMGLHIMPDNDAYAMVCEHQSTELAIDKKITPKFNRALNEGAILKMFYRIFNVADCYGTFEEERFGEGEVKDSILNAMFIFDEHSEIHLSYRINPEAYDFKYYPEVIGGTQNG